MKLRKRTIFVAAMIFLFAAVCAGGCGKEKNVISVTGGEVKEGEEITVYVRASDEIPVAAFGFEVHYNPEFFTFKECEKTEAFKKAWAGLDVTNDTDSDSGKVVMMVGVNTNKKEEQYKGDLYYITFTATGKKGTKADLNLKVSALEDLDQKKHMDEFTVKNGKIKIK